jgi:hypothetical protein
LPDWAREGLAAAERSAGGRGKVSVVQLGVEETPGKGGAIRFSRELFTLFRKRILFVKGVERALPFDGMVNSGDPNTIVIDADAPSGLSYLFGHELGHSIQHQRPDLYDAFQEELLGMANDWSDYREKLRGPYQTDEQFRAEFTNDFIGNQMGDPVFWKRLQDRNPGVFRRLVDAALEFLKGLGSKIGSLERDVRPYFKDIESARHSLVKMLEEYQGGPMPEQSVRPRELPDAGDDIELSKNITRAGVTRRNTTDWRKVRDLWDELGYREILSDENRSRIATGLVPVVDEDWINVHPEDAGLRGQIISIHHVLGLPLSGPVPYRRHLNAHMPGGTRFNSGGLPSQLPIYPEKK